MSSVIHRIQKMKDSQSIGKEKVFSKESPMKPFEAVSSDKEQNHNKKLKPLKSEKSDNSELLKINSGC
ncbi:hypothetical protein L1987_10797 [Smallanthus sonchifolius]|uniref:Uncharacterized protein n=1 Tax=Smallanthus sonchifolius TaxID=185202 RepID=A0ACB9JBT1_9ASTR|nr:hypothetical protein L1987_10797 [Smallanthus sonchifolius]